MTTGSLRLRTMIDGTLVSAPHHPSDHLFFNGCTCARVRVPTLPSPPSLPHSCSCVCLWVFYFPSLHLSPMPQNPLTHSFVRTLACFFIVTFSSLFFSLFFFLSNIKPCTGKLLPGYPRFHGGLRDLGCWNMPRGCGGIAHVEAVGQPNIDQATLLKVMTTWPTFNHHTDFTIVCSPSNASMYQTLVWSD